MELERHARRDPQRPRGLQAGIRGRRGKDLQARQSKHGRSPGLGTLLRVGVRVRVRVRARVRVRVRPGLCEVRLSTFVEVERGELAPHGAVHEHLASSRLRVRAILTA